MIGQYQDLENKTFLVTGGSSGIGQAVALALSAQRASVIITGRHPERLNDTLGRLNDRCSALPCDLTSAEARAQLVGSLPALDGICHAAGIIDPFPIRFIDQARFEKMFAINTAAPVLLTAALLGGKKLRQGASIVFISSVSSGYGMKGGSLYTASKAALEAFSRGIVLEHASKGIRANCLKPSLVRTPMYDQAADLTNLEHATARHPLGFGEAEDVASAALFLLSDASRWIASTSLVMDGGMSAGI